MATDLHINYTLHILFRMLVPPRRKYGLTVNMLIVLNACYLYQKYIGSDFSKKAITKFTRYYDFKYTTKLLWALKERECVIEAYFRGGYQFYKITEKGIEIVESINEGYEKTLAEFLNKYNIVL